MFYGFIPAEDLPWRGRTFFCLFVKILAIFFVLVRILDDINVSERSDEAGVNEAKEAKLAGFVQHFWLTHRKGVQVPEVVLGWSIPPELPSFIVCERGEEDVASCGKPARMAPERNRKRSSCALKIIGCSSSPSLPSGDEAASVGLDGTFPRRGESMARQTTTVRMKALSLARLFYFEKVPLSTRCSYC